MADCQIYLVPGFFGFTALGDFNYFQCVSEVLESALRRRGVEATIVECPTLPTGSITRRADRLRRHVLATKAMNVNQLHFVGHSTGGLDVRLLLSPGVRLAADKTEEEIGRRTLSAISVSTPHYGTPLATFFTTVQGRHLLLLLAALATSRQGRSAIYFGARFASIVAGLDDFLGRRDTLLDHVANRLLRRISTREGDPLWSYLREISADQGAVLQLTPESMNLFNAAVVDRSEVTYSCVAAAAPQPPVGYGVWDLLPPQRGTVAAIFSILHTITARMHHHYPYPDPDLVLHEPIRNLPFPVTTRSNDGIVPVASQLHGRLLQAVVADHLDVVGQFHRPGESLSDWLPSGAHFDQERFEHVWSCVADEIVRARTRKATVRDRDRQPGKRRRAGKESASRKNRSRLRVAGGSATGQTCPHSLSTPPRLRFSRGCGRHRLHPRSRSLYMASRAPPRHCAMRPSSSSRGLRPFPDTSSRCD